MIKLKKGLDLPISGAPEQRIEDAAECRSVALVGFDYVGLKPTMTVAVGDRVKTGQVLFEDKKNEGLRFTAPASGVVSAINRGNKRVLQSIVIDVEGDDAETFDVGSGDIAARGRDVIASALQAAGLWTAFRKRPYSKVPALDAQPAAIFVNAMDTGPLAGDPLLVINEQSDAFCDGLKAVAQLTEGKLFVCHAAGSTLPAVSIPNMHLEAFAGPHPAGLPGTHIHYLAPASMQRTVWTVGYQDIIAIGKFMQSGQLYTDRVVALGGPGVEKPRLLRTRIGADLLGLTAGELKPGTQRIVSGSILGGRTARTAVAWLGRYHNQVSVLEEGHKREFMGWLSPGINKHSTLGIYLSQFFGGKKFDFNTTTNGSERAMVPMGTYERVMPLDILPTQLLRALIVGDTATAQELGALELDEEDLALCTYVCPGKYEYGPILRDNLNRIEKEG